MKRLMFATVAALTMAGSLATPAAAQSWGQNDNRGDDNDRRGDRNDDRRGDRNDDRRGDRDGDRRGDRADRNDRDDRGRNQRSRWDNNRHNGYTYNGRWYYGPPPAAHQGRNGYESGYRNWRRGERVPAYYRDRYRQVDYRREHLRAPPRGYRYVEDDRGDMLLVGIATGVILSVILANNY
jgi:Ni/Co efflux regulator RcnB